MGFLSPGLLFLAAALAVPLVLHLFQRHQGPRLIFPALRYLQRAEKEHARQIKLRQLLLLALRLAALAMVVLAAARPFLRSAGGAHEPTAVVIVLDNSLSSGLVVGDRRVLDRLKERALETLGRGGPDDRFWLIRAGAPWEPALPGDAATTAARVEETDVAAGAADLGLALERARTLLAAGAEGRAAEIHLLSDLQATGFEAPVPVDDDQGPPVIVWAPDEDVPANAAVADVEVGGGLAPRAGERSTVAARIVGSRAGDSLTVRLAIDGRIAAADMAPTGSVLALPFAGRAAGLAAGWVEIDPDALRGDDRRYFVVRVQPPPSVGLTRPAPFIEEALGVLADAGRIRRASTDAADVVLAPAAEGVQAVRAGRAVIVLPPASPLELPAANRRLAAAGVPWRFSAPEGAGEARFDAAAGDAELARTLGRVRVRTVYGLTPQGAPAGGVTDDDGRPTPTGASADSVLLRLRDGLPWAVRGSLPAGGRYLVLGSPLSPEASTLPTSPAMLLLLDRLLGPWTASQAARLEALPGERVPLPGNAEAVERPDGGRDAVERGGWYRVPPQPGVYRVLAGEEVVDAFAVNPSPAESRLDRIGKRDLQALLPGWPLVAVDDVDGWGRAVFQRRLGSEVWRPIVGFALALLLIEGLAAATGPGRARLQANRGGPARPAAEPVPAGRQAAAPPTGRTERFLASARRVTKFAGRSAAAPATDASTRTRPTTS